MSSPVFYESDYAATEASDRTNFYDVNLFDVEGEPTRIHQTRTLTEANELAGEVSKALRSWHEMQPLVATSTPAIDVAIDLLYELAANEDFTCSTDTRRHLTAAAIDLSWLKRQADAKRVIASLAKPAAVLTPRTDPAIDAMFQAFEGKAQCSYRPHGGAEIWVANERVVIVTDDAEPGNEDNAWFAALYVNEDQINEGEPADTIEATDATLTRAVGALLQLWVQ